MKKTMFTAALAAVVALSFIGTASGAKTNYGYVSDYVGTGKSFDIGSITFSDFSFHSTSLGALPVGGNQTISLSGEVIGDQVKLYFNGGWSANPGQWVDTTIDFKALSSVAIMSNTLALTAFSSSGGATISVTENVTDTKGGSVADKFVVWYSGTPENKLVIDTVSFSPAQTEVRIHKDIFVTGGDTTGGYGHISGFSQSFLVPEPMTLITLALGGLLISRKR